jgi:hypothetical protein
MRLGRSAGFGSLAFALLLICVFPDSTKGQASAALFFDEAIPRDRYTSWSLFLVTNQDWLVADHSEQLAQLYERSQAFGDAIGEKHVAVWFWKERWSSFSQPEARAIATHVDVARSIRYCSRLGLKPSEGPYFLFTATYPDDRTPPDAYIAIALAGRSPREISVLLKDLGDQLVVDGVLRDGKVQQALGSDDFWVAWLSATRHTLERLGSNIRLISRTRASTVGWTVHSPPSNKG